MISTHTLLAERDQESLEAKKPARISTHTLLAERDAKMGIEYNAQMQFLLTRSSRSVTLLGACQLQCYPISTHTLLAERDCTEKQARYYLSISTHTLLAERDHIEKNTHKGIIRNFYSHAPRGA